MRVPQQPSDAHTLVGWSQKLAARVLLRIFLSMLPILGFKPSRPQCMCVLVLTVGASQAHDSKSEYANLH